ncbi:hypothetical protein ACUUMB_22850 [Enterobacter kobei]
MSTSAQFVYRDDQQAMVTFDGTVRNDGSNYKIQRTLVYRYSHFPETIFMSVK